jgi:hypothetical protein
MPNDLFPWLHETLSPGSREISPSEGGYLRVLANNSELSREDPTRSPDSPHLSAYLRDARGALFRSKVQLSL